MTLGIDDGHLAAFAKFVGSYDALDGGFASWAWQALTGEENQARYQREPSDGLWTKLMIDAEKQRQLNLPFLCQFKDTGEKVTDDRMFGLLKWWDEKKACD